MKMLDFLMEHIANPSPIALSLGMPTPQSFPCSVELSDQ